MPACVTITEIIDRAEQGMTRPFLCRDNVFLYYVKGKYAGQRSLCCEWLAGNLAQSIVSGYPVAVPHFSIASVPKALVEGSARADAGDLGAGLVFASSRVEDAQEINWTTAQHWSAETMAAVLLLDLWLQNEDRSLSAAGGNPNLLVSLAPGAPDLNGLQEPSGSATLWAYDFNLAFDECFDRRRFFQSHVFGGMVRQWPAQFRQRMEEQMAVAIGQLPQFVAGLPDEWLYLDGDDTLPVQLDLERVSSVLKLPFTRPDEFWALP